jgi:hypothetical protein
MSDAPDQTTFLALFLGSATDKEKQAELSAAQQKEFMEQWIRWATDHEASIVDNGTPLGPNTRVTSSSATEESNRIVAYSIVRAASKEAAAKIFAEHPHLSLGTDLSIEVMERLPVPEQPS